jgi:glutathione synthase/RimK-type ligase-like ATP-grasp enzyme
MKKLGLVAVGDRKDFDSFMKLHKSRKEFARSPVAYYAVSYRDLIKGRVPRVREERVLFFFFFPFEHWNRNIETKRYRGLYGNATFYRKFVSFFESVEKSIVKGFAGKEISFINPPGLSARYRDKLTVKKLLMKNRIPTPEMHGFSRVNDIYRFLSTGRSLFLKVRYGSMGKGITYISPSLWKTNFVFRRRKILSRKSDYGWHFRDITRRENFLEKLMQADIYKEEAVDSLLTKGRKFDLRVYVFFGKAVFIYPRTNEPNNITTNITQQGKGERPGFLRILPKRLIGRVKAEAVRSAKSLGLNFAGVDVIVDRNLSDVYIIDINVFPGFPNRRIFNLGKYLVREMKSRDFVENLNAG